MSAPHARSRITVRVGGAPEPALLRAAIAARLSGLPFPAGPEDEVATAVAQTVLERGAPPTTGGGARAPGEEGGAGRWR